MGCTRMVFRAVFLTSLLLASQLIRCDYVSQFLMSAKQIPGWTAQALGIE